MTNTFSKYLDKVLLNFAKRIENTPRGKTYDWETEKQAILSQHEKELEKARLETKVRALEVVIDYSNTQHKKYILQFKNELERLKPNTTKDNDR